MENLILIVDDDAFQRETLALLMRRRLHMNAVLADGGKAALDILASEQGALIRAVILDVNMPGLNGMDVLAIIVEQYAGIPVVMLTGSTDVDLAVRAMQIGAVDFVSKPWQSDRMIATIENALKLSQLTQEVSRLRRKEKGEAAFSDLIGYDQGLAAAVNAGRKAASSNIPVLLSGDTGVGKEMFARAIHGESARAGQPFIAVNCGAIPPNLIESILFGHEKGAFTGAIAKSPGKFREADGGTIFLDEVGELPLEAQTRLLRVLQQKEVEPVGAARAVPINVRVLSATHKHLEHEVKNGTFREDLFFRLNVLQITIPSLDARRSDIPELTRYFLDRFSADGKGLFTITPDAMAKLAQYKWPGNVRELENALYRATVLADQNTLTIDDFAFLGQTDRPSEQNLILSELKIDLTRNGQPKTLAQIEEEAIERVLDLYHGNVQKTAKALDIPKSTFYRRMKNKE